MTDAEIKLWQKLRCRQINGFRFRKQAPIGRYIVDFICHETRLIVELDGGQHTETIEYDAERTQCESNRPPSFPSPTRGEGTRGCTNRAHHLHLKPGTCFTL